MKNLYLVGKAPPINKKKHNTPFPSGELTDLVALDPRHGVFPNLVMTPLFATVMAFYEDGNNENTFAILEQSKEILKDHSDRRMNVFYKPTDEILILDSQTRERLDSLDNDNNLWLVFKHSSAYALISYLLFGKTQFTEKDLKKDGINFLKKVAEAPGCNLTIPKKLNTQVGVLFQLFSGEDSESNGVINHLRYAVETLAPNRDAVRIVKILRSIVPLLHNDAYDKPVVGLIQNRFMVGFDLPATNPNHENIPENLYWRFIGNAIKKRLLTTGEIIPSME